MNLAISALTLLLTLAPGGDGTAGADNDSAILDLRPAEVSAARLEVGSRIRVTGKYKERINEELLLVDCPVPFLLRRADLSRALLEFTPNRDNLTVTGTVVADPAHTTAVEVDSLAAGPSDAERFRREAATLAGGGAASAHELLNLAERIKHFQEEREDPDLEGLIEDVLQKAVRAIDGAFPSGDAGPRLAFVREMHALLGDRDLTVEFLLDLGSRYPGDAAVQQFLRELDCRHYQGRWVTQEEFKRREGLVLHAGHWLTPGEKDFLDSLKDFKSETRHQLLLLRHRTDREYRLLADGGRVETGMIPQEICAAIGFPDRVRRRVLDGMEYDQWCYEGKYYYFYGGVLIRTPREDGK